ncbi:hypothetical protein [Colwellia sp. MEBiC06753]
MYKRFSFVNPVLFCSLLMTAMSAVNAQSSNELDIARLGNFAVSFSELSPVNELKGAAVMAEVVTKPNAPYKVMIPLDIQQVQFAVYNGQYVNQGDVIGTIDGFDTHHFIDELAAAKTLYLKNNQHLEQTQRYADEQTIKSAQWLETHKNYLDAKLKYEHFSHLESQISIDQNEVVTLISPKSGIVQLNAADDTSVYQVIPTESFYLKAYLPSQEVNRLIGFDSEQLQCQFTIDSVELVVSNYQQAVWLKPSKDCRLLLGQQMVLAPSYRIANSRTPINQSQNNLNPNNHTQNNHTQSNHTQSYQVSQSAVFELDDQEHVAVKQGDKLKVVAINIVGKQGGSYLVQSAELSAQDQVLSSSVSIAQGMFIGLGE